MAGRHSRRSRRARTAAVIGRVVADNRDIAAALQNEARGRWLVMWSSWRQMFTAFACATTEPLIIDDADFNRLRSRIVGW